MKITIPSKSKRITQPNVGDIYGHLWSSQNLDLIGKRGKMSPSSLVYVRNDNSDDSDLKFIQAFARTDADGTDRWWAMGDSGLFKTSGTDPSGAWTKDAIASSPSGPVVDSSDMVEFEEALIVSVNAQLFRLDTTWNSSWWTGTLSQSGLTSGVPHPMEVFQRLLVIGDDNVVHVVDRDSNVYNTRLTFSPGYVVTFIESSNSRVWIGLSNESGKKCAVAEWDGYSSSYLKIHPLDGFMAMCCSVDKYDAPYVLTNSGILYRYNGSAFVEDGYLPVWYEKIIKHDASYLPNNWSVESDNDYKPVHFNGMDIIDGRPHVVISGMIDGEKMCMEQMKSGIWCFDPEIGFFHRYSFSMYKTGDSSVVDYGNCVLRNPGALKCTGDQSRTTKFLAGGTFMTDNFVTRHHAIFINDPDSSLENKATFATAKFESGDVDEIWDKLWIKFRKLLSSQEIKIKYRYGKDEDRNLPFIYLGSIATGGLAITVTGATEIFAEGDEVEVLTGESNCSVTRQIDSVTDNGGGSYTITLDEALPYTTAMSGLIAIRDWKLLDTVTDTDINFEDFGIGETDTWVKFKFELTGTYQSPEIEEIIIHTLSNINSKI